MFFFGKRRRAQATPPATDKLVDGLQALARSAFPKRCGACGRIYTTLEQYLRECVRRAPRAGETDDSSLTRVDLYRRCVCGATLSDCFSDRRDYSESGVERRELFGELIDSLSAEGVAPEVARAELLVVLAGQPSAVLQLAPSS